MTSINKNAATRKQGGFIMTAELILLATVMVVGLIAGMVTMRDAATAEMEDVAEAIGSLDQSYAFQGLQNAEKTAVVDGSSFGDAVDANAGDEAKFEFIALDESEGRASLVAANAGADSAEAIGTTTP